MSYYLPSSSNFIPASGGDGGGVHDGANNADNGDTTQLKIFGFIPTVEIGEKLAELFPNVVRGPRGEILKATKSERQKIRAFLQQESLKAKSIFLSRDDNGKLETGIHIKTPKGVLMNWAVMANQASLPFVYREILMNRFRMEFLRSNIHTKDTLNDMLESLRSQLQVSALPTSRELKLGENKFFEECKTCLAYMVDDRVKNASIFMDNVCARKFESKLAKQLLYTSREYETPSKTVNQVANKILASFNSGTRESKMETCISLKHHFLKDIPEWRCKILECDDFIQDPQPENFVRLMNVQSKYRSALVMHATVKYILSARNMQSIVMEANRYYAYIQEQREKKVRQFHEEMERKMLKRNGIMLQHHLDATSTSSAHNTEETSQDDVAMERQVLLLRGSRPIDNMLMPTNELLTDHNMRAIMEESPIVVGMSGTSNLLRQLFFHIRTETSAANKFEYDQAALIAMAMIVHSGGHSFIEGWSVFHGDVRANTRPPLDFAQWEQNGGSWIKNAIEVAYQACYVMMESRFQHPNNESNLFNTAMTSPAIFSLVSQTQANAILREIVRRLYNALKTNSYTRETEKIGKMIHGARLGVQLARHVKTCDDGHLLDSYTEILNILYEDGAISGEIVINELLGQKTKSLLPSPLLVASSKNWPSATVTDMLETIARAVNESSDPKAMRKKVLSLMSIKRKVNEGQPIDFYKLAKHEDKRSVNETAKFILYNHKLIEKNRELRKLCEGMYENPVNKFFRRRRRTSASVAPVPVPLPILLPQLPTSPLTTKDRLTKLDRNIRIINSSRVEKNSLRLYEEKQRLQQHKQVSTTPMMTFAEQLRLRYAQMSQEEEKVMQEKRQALAAQRAVNFDTLNREKKTAKQQQALKKQEKRYRKLEQELAVAIQNFYAQAEIMAN